MGVFLGDDSALCACLEWEREPREAKLWLVRKAEVKY